MNHTIERSPAAEGEIGGLPAAASPPEDNWRQGAGDHGLAPHAAGRRNAEHLGASAAIADHTARAENVSGNAGATEPKGRRGKASGWRPGTAAATILTRAFQNRSSSEGVSAKGASPTALERLLQSIAGDYGTHALVLEALIEILVSKGIVSEDEFEDLLETIDARDGRIDGTLGDPDYNLGEGI